MDTNEGSTPPVTLVQGVPQGAVLSPTLFNLLMSELASLLPPKVKYTMYADDLCIWSSGRQIQAIENTLQYALVTIAIFLEERAMDLSTSKTVYLPFTGKRLKNFKLTVAGTEIRRVTKHKYLGVTINRNTTWGDQVNHLEKSTRTYTNIMKILGGYRWGNNKALQAMHRGLIRQTIAYSIPCLQNLSPSQDNRLQRILSRSLRICLGLPRTVRTDIVLAEGREPPIQTLRKQETERHLIRLLTRHYGHPLIDKIKQRTKCSIYKAIRYIDRILPKHRAKRHYQDTAPWLLLPPKISTEVPGIDKKNETPQVALKALAMAHIEENYPVAMQVYTDGSTSKNRSSSAFVTDGITKAYRLSHKTTSTAAEQHAILKALRHIRKSQAGTWVVCSDSRAALYSIQKQDPQDRIVYNIMKAHSEAEALGHNISLQWIPSHCDISGNECADRAAKEAPSKSRISAIPFTKSDAKSLLRKSTERRSRTIWKQSMRPKDYLAFIDPEADSIIPNGIERSVKTAIHRTRLGALYTGTTRRQLRLCDSDLCKRCKVPEDTHHIIRHCPEYSQARLKLQQTLAALDNRPFSFCKITGRWPTRHQQSKALKALCVFLKDSGIKDRF
ncbi:uncharacterized protein LOC135384479 [Ornithodoros turicata]|uniref:uncharacterized protein LOC135384479 n=1 Tax=Ornithodoros turicata TaxID=34597 RepID=UPI0031388890